MKNLPQPFLPEPDRYADGFFDVIVRNADSAVIFWDLHGTVPFTETSDRAKLAARVSPHSRFPTASAAATPNPSFHLLPDFTGHLFLPLRSTAATYRIDIGWIDSEQNFHPLGSETVCLPDAPANHPSRSFSGATPTRHARYGRLASPATQRTLRPNTANLPA